MKSSVLRALFSLLVTLVLVDTLQAQSAKRVNIWYFGYNAGLNFNGGSPVVLSNGALATREGCATIADESGQLVLYTDGISIWNKNHQVIPNATNLGGNSSATQSGIIVPQPENPGVYFVFSVDYQGRSGGVQGAIVDMQLNGGLGGIVRKNIILMPYASEKLTAVQHANGRDFWVIAHDLDNTFKSFLLTKDGINTSAVESKIGVAHSVTQITDANALGYMKASPTGKKLAVGVYGNSSFEVFDFDATTGKLSNQLLLKHPDLYGAYGVEFSPDGNLLYGSCIEVRPSKIYQFDLCLNTADEILNSRTLIAEVRGTYLGAIQVGPDGKLYVAIDNYNYLGIINSPNKRGVDCQFVLDGIDLGGKMSGLGLPNIMPSYFYVKPTASIDTKRGAGCNDITLQATYTPTAPTLLYQWYLDNKAIPGGNQSTLKPAQSGLYHVRVKEAGKCTIDSAQSTPVSLTLVTANPQALNLGCGKVLLKATTKSTVRWLGSAIPTGREKQDTLTISGTGTQTVTLRVLADSATNCYVEKELTVTFPASASYSIGKKSLGVCDSVLVDAPTSPNWTTYTWTLPNSTTVASTKLLVKQSGLYTITVRNPSTGCEARDQLNVSIGQKPVVKPDERLCLSGTSIELQAAATGNNLQYQWLATTSTGPTLVVSQAGDYQVRISTPEGCSVTRSINVLPSPVADLGADKVFCEGQSIELAPVGAKTTSDIQYRWSTGSTQSSIKPATSGAYQLTVSQGICQSSASVNVTINPAPRVKNDETICLGGPVDAGGLATNLAYLWEHANETTPQITVSGEGIYKVKISTPLGCAVTRTVTIQGYCEAHLSIPDAFTPNGDGINDSFRIFVNGAIIQRLSIYNRWGEVVFSDGSANPQWNGQYNERPCQSGFYSYRIIYKTVRDGKELSQTGQILLVL